jgi:hypothetical protein
MLSIVQERVEKVAPQQRKVLARRLAKLLPLLPLLLPAQRVHALDVPKDPRVQEALLEMVSAAEDQQE